LRLPRQAINAIALVRTCGTTKKTTIHHRWNFCCHGAQSRTGCIPVLIGERLAERLPLKAIRWIAAGVFMLTGMVVILGTFCSFTL